MILVGNQRGGGRDLARHLMKDDNERVTVHEVRGFMASDLEGAFLESHAISKATRCKQHLYSLSLNPPKDADPTPELFQDAIARAEERLGLQGQPRAIVFHEKIGADGELRRHAHAVWCRIDTDAMKAVQLSYDKTKLNDLARELYIEHGWTMPRGFVRSTERDPRNFSLAEWQQAKRAKKDPRALKTMFQDAWAISDTQSAFAHALRERGYILARGDRNGVVAVDHRGEVYAVRTYVGIKTRQVREKVKDTASLPDVTAARNAAAKIVSDKLNELRAQELRRAKERLDAFALRRKRARSAQKQATNKLATEQAARETQEESKRQARLRTGWRGLIDRVTGKRKKLLAQNFAEAQDALRRDQAERQAVLAFQKAARQELLDKVRSINRVRKEVLRELHQDIEQLRPVDPPREDKAEKDREAYTRKQRREARRPRRRSRSRDGPSPGL